MNHCTIFILKWVLDIAYFNNCWPQNPKNTKIIDLPRQNQKTISSSLNVFPSLQILFYHCIKEFIFQTRQLWRIQTAAEVHNKTKIVGNNRLPGLWNLSTYIVIVWSTRKGFQHSPPQTTWKKLQRLRNVFIRNKGVTQGWQHRGNSFLSQLVVQSSGTQ